MIISASQAYMPTHNQRLVLDLIRQRGPISRADIVRLSGLTFPSVSRIVGELIDRNLVAEKRQRRGGMGKPPTELEVNPKSAFSIGLNLDRDHLSAVLVDLAGEVLGEVHHALEDPGPKRVLPLMAEAVEQLVGAAAVPRSLLLGAGVGFPAPLYTYKVSGTLPDDLQGWASVELGSELGQKLGCPVLLENNATAAAIGERWYGVGRSVSHFFLVFFAHGVGGGLVLGSKPHLGYRGFGGEFGNMPVRHSEPGAPSNVGEYLAPWRLMQRLSEAGKGSSAAELEALLAAGDETLLGWLDTAALHLAPALVYVECLVDPEAIIFGGRLPAPLIDALIARVGERLPEYRNEVKPYQPKLLRGESGKNAAALGAATLPIYRAMTPDPGAEEVTGGKVPLAAR